MDIYHNANIYSPLQPEATAMVVDHGMIIALGSDVDILNSFSQAKSRQDLKGYPLWPGLTDSHVHLQHLAESAASVDCETPTMQACLDRIQSSVKSLPENAWVRGHGWNHNHWPGGYGTAQDLDLVCENHPAYLTAKSLHAAWVNSRALDLAGIDSDTPDPPGGHIQRDHNGDPTGILFEGGAMPLVESIIPERTLPELASSLRSLIPKLWAAGLTALHDFDGFDCWQVLQTLENNHELQLRVQKHIPYGHLETFIQAGLHTNFGSDWLRLGCVKLFSDGALGPQTAAMLQPYQDSDNAGTLLLTEDEITNIGEYAVSHGLGLAIHAIGDRANRVVINALEKVINFQHEKRLPPHRHRVEHVQTISPTDLPRLAALNIIASVQPVHAPSDMRMADRFLGERSESSYAYRSLFDSGAHMIFGSDAPVEPFNPFIGLHAAVTRRQLDGSPGPDGWHPEQKLTLAEALPALTINPSISSGMGNKLGLLQPGYLADFLILEKDPFSIDPHELAEIKPVATFINGSCVYRSPELSLERL